MIPDKASYATVYLRCVEKKIPIAVRDRLKAVQPEVSKLYGSYIAKASAASLFDFPVAATLKLGDDYISDQEMHDLYDTSMVRKKGGGRPDYDRIKVSASLGICPYCGQLPVKTLDHYLPRSKWKLLSVCGVNLVPCCRDCNSEKKEHSPTSAGELLFHPYFDDKDAHAWLAAGVVEAKPVMFEFRVECASGGEPFSARAATHFEKLNLKVLYESQAASEIASIAAALARVYGKNGADGVREELEARAQDNADRSLNSWRSAMYRGAAQSEWFCDLRWL